MAPLFSDKEGTTVAFSKCGKGSVIVLCDSWSLSNAGIGKGDNFILVLNALKHRDPSRRLTVTFDEYHHGYGKKKGLLSLIGLPAKLGLIQIGMAFVLLIFAVSRRFGTPIQLKEGTRERSEYLSSMSSLLRRAHATSVVRTELGRRFLDDIAAVLSMPPRSDPDAIIQKAVMRYPDKAGALRELIDEAASAGESGSDANMLSLAIRWHHIRKELMKKR